MKKIAVVGLACPTEVGFELAPALLQKTAAALKKEYQVIDTGTVISCPEDTRRVLTRLSGQVLDALIVCVGTWSEDHHILQLLGELRCFAVLHAFPSVDSGSLCATHQMASVLTDVHVTSYAGICAEAGSDEALAAIRAALEKATPPAGNLSRPQMTIGSVGGRVQGMTEIAFDEFALLEKCGAVVIPISEAELTELVRAADPAAVQAVCDDLARRPYRQLSSDEALRESAAYYLAMKQLVQKYDLQGLAVRCYTGLMGKVCLGYSLLSEEGIVCSCEGDVTNTVMMRLLADLTGGCVNHTDFLYPDEKTNSALFSHCGSCGFSMAKAPEDVELAPVRLMETGVCCRFLPKTGTVTAADLVGHGDRLRMSVMVGTAIDCGMDFPGTPMRVQFKKPVWALSQEILKKGCGHHWMIGYGDVSAQLEDYCRAHGILFQRVGE